MQNEIINFLPNQNDYVIGFADMEDLILKYYPYRYAIVVGAKMNDTIIDDIENGPTMDYYNLYYRQNAGLNDLVQKISDYLTKHNIDNKYILSTVSDTKLDEEHSKALRYYFSHKMAATRAGLGWIGKTDLLISEKFGPRFRMASVLTSYKFEKTGNPVTESRCGSCSICVDKCPAKAANGKLWNITVDRDEFYDAQKCKDMCRKISSERIQKEISICGICISVCPKGKHLNT
jgi:epoxyqueuosine reductase